MFRTDVTTAAGTLPTPAAPGTPGFFTNGNPALGVPATIVDQDWLNRLQEELMSLLTSTSITPVKSNYTQVLQAILALGLVFDVGVVNTLVANPSPPLSSLVLGTQLTLIPLNNNNAASTLNVSSLGALSLLRPDGTTLQPNDLMAGRRQQIIYDGTAWRLLTWPSQISLGGPLTLFCNPQTGNDSNNGLTLGTAFGSLQGIWNYLAININAAGQTITIQCSGNFTAGLVAANPVNGTNVNTIIFNFASGSTFAVTNGSCFIATSAVVGFTVQGLGALSASGTGTGQGVALYAQFGARIKYSGITFGVCASGHTFAQQGGQIIYGGAYTIAGNAPAHWLFAAGQIYPATPTIAITLTGTPAFSTGFVEGTDSGGHCDVPSGITFGGAATGPRFSLALNATLNTYGQQALVSTAYLPGNANGVFVSGGQFG